MSEVLKTTSRLCRRPSGRFGDAIGWLEQYAQQNDEPYLVTEAIADLHYALRYLKDANGP